MLIWPSGKNAKQTQLKVSSAKCLPFCLWLSMLIYCTGIRAYLHANGMGGVRLGRNEPYLDLVGAYWPIIQKQMTTNPAVHYTYHECVRITVVIHMAVEYCTLYLNTLYCDIALYSYSVTQYRKFHSIFIILVSFSCLIYLFTCDVLILATVLSFMGIKEHRINLLVFKEADTISLQITSVSSTDISKFKLINTLFTS